MTVSQEEKDAMARLLAMMNGEAVPSTHSQSTKKQVVEAEEIGGPGVVTQRAINAMADVLGKLNKVTQQVILENNGSTDTKLDIMTRRDESGVTVGSYKIDILINEKRLAGKQYYKIVHTGSNTTIADDITLYEVALGVVKLLNNNRYVNDNTVRKLFECDDRYTGYRVDAMTAKISQRKAEKRGDQIKEDIFGTRYQKALDLALTTKNDIRTILKNER